MATSRRKFEDELKDLEGVVAQIDSGELSLEDSITAFERGVGLVRSLNQKLDEVERKVDLLMRNAQGELTTAPYDPAATPDEGVAGQHDRGQGNSARQDNRASEERDKGGHKKGDDDIPF